jgi:predicted branched-subunit amino acid permease
MKWIEFRSGVRDGLPVGIGYFSVSFGFGALAITYGLQVLQATLISLTNLTSAGQFAGLTVMAASASMMDMVLTQLVINSRYALMSLALSQKLGKEIGTLPRLVISFFVTDEIFALAMERTRALTISYMLGLASLPILGWVSGTFCGAAASSVLPLSVRTALGVALYGMFVAIVVPQARKEKPFLITAGIAAALSCMMEWIPLFQSISDGIAIVLSTVIAAAICAVAFPVEEKKEAAK